VRAWVPWLMVVAVIGLMPSAPVHSQTPAAQENAEKGTGDRAQGTSDKAQPLDTFLLRDSKGNLVPVLGISFEEFEQLLRSKKGLSPAAAPAYTLERLTITGTADERTADFELNLSVRLREAGWVRVPLLMASAVLREAPQYRGSGEFFIEPDAKVGGYVCWLKGGSSQPHSVTLRLSVAVKAAGGERQLSLALPAATESSLRLAVAGAGVEVAKTSGEGILTTRAVPEQRTELTVLGAAGDLQLQWRPQAVTSASAGRQLDVNGEISVRIQSEHRITSDARLRVRSFGPPLESFRVRLPAGMELLPAAPTPGMTVTPIAPTAAPAGKSAPAGQVVEVRLDKPASGVIEIVLRAGRDAETVSPTPLHPGRFDVLGAVRQRGTIDFVMDGEWQLEWTEDKSVHRIDLTPDTAAAHVVARFEYFRQPCGLGVKVTSLPSRVSVESTYTLYVDSQRVRIETQLKYHFRGSRAAGLSFALGDWTFDRLLPDALLEFPVAGAEQGALIVPFRPGAAPPTELELKLEAHQLLAPGSDRLDLTFPRPVADIIAPATVLVFAADNLELQPQMAELRGLSPDPTVVHAPGHEHAALAFRDFGGTELSQFVARIRSLARITTAGGRAKIRIDRDQIHVEQTLDYRVSHEPQSTFLITCPRAVLAAGTLQAWSNDERLPLSPTADATEDESDGKRLQLTTPGARLGSFQISLRYSLPLVWDGKSAAPLEIPFVLPADTTQDQFTGQQVQLAVSEGMDIEPDQATSNGSAAPSVQQVGAAQVYSWNEPVPVTPWRLQPGQTGEAVPVEVSQVWVQTWLGAQVREERVALRVTTQQDSVRVRLPAGVRPRSVLTAVDGQEVAHGNVRDTGQVTISLPAAARARACVLEVYYTLDPPTPFWGLIGDELQTARIEEAIAPRRVYWQLVLPQEEHLLTAPRTLTSEMAWAAEGGFIVQRPVMDQRQLEAWMRASRQAPLPRGANVYLFGAVGEWPTFAVVAAPRRVIVAVGSGLVLAIGMLLIHVPRARSPSLVLVLSTGVAGVALVAPQIALLTLQGAALGVAIVMMAAAFAWLSSGRPTMVPTRTSAASRVRGSSMAHPALTSPASSPSGTPRSDRSSRLTATTPAITHAVEARP